MTFIEKAEARFIEWLLDNYGIEKDQASLLSFIATKKFKGCFMCLKHDAINPEITGAWLNKSRWNKILYRRFNSTMELKTFHDDQAYEVQTYEIYVQDFLDNIEWYDRELQSYTEGLEQEYQYHGQGESVAENDLENAYQWADSADFEGSPKQINWARDIATKNCEYIVSLWEAGEEPTLSAKWWIDNRQNL